VAEGRGGAYAIPEKYEMLPLCGLKDVNTLNYVFLKGTPGTSDPLHTIKFIPEIDMLFPCENSQSFHLHMGEVLRFTTQAMI